MDKLQRLLTDIVGAFTYDTNLIKTLHEYNINKMNIITNAAWALNDLEKLIAHGVDNTEAYCEKAHEYIEGTYGTITDILTLTTRELGYYLQSSQRRLNVVELNPRLIPVFTYQLLLQLNYNALRDTIGLYRDKHYSRCQGLVVDDRSPFWDLSGMVKRVFPSQYEMVRVYTREILDSISVHAETDLMLLHEMTAEIIKNAVKHGNHSDPDKKVFAWFRCHRDFFKVIVRDEGEGFKNIEDWNEFFRKRNEAIRTEDFEKMMQYINYRTEKSAEDDGGNALISALEYWDTGLIYGKHRNNVVAVKYFYE